MKKFIAPALWIVAFQLVSGVIGYFTASNMDWYNTLEKSSFTPPDIVFPVVWTTLYVLLAIAAYLVWEDYRRDGMRPAFVLFWMHMFMNWTWSFVFFEFQIIALGFYWICGLNFLMIAYILVQWRTNKIAASLVIPTVLWGSFAGYLNYQIMVLN